MNRYISFITGIVVILCFCSFSSADTVILKSGERAKGLILDEFKDRIILSTAEGEKVIMKSDIRSAIYDSEEKALIQKGKNQVKKGQYIKAYHTYKKAVELNPDLEEARDRLNYLRSYLETKTKNGITSSIAKYKERFEGMPGKTPPQRVTAELGLVLVPGKKYVSIERIQDNNPSDTGSDLKPGDKIISVWGEMAAYMDVDEVVEMLLSSGEAKFAIERPVAPRLSSAKVSLNGLLFSGYKRVIGADLELRKEGVIVRSIIPGGSFEVAGIHEGDLLCRINGRNTRYMPMAQIIDVIEKNQNKKIEIVIQRDSVLWGKE